MAKVLTLLLGMFCTAWAEGSHAEDIAYVNGNPITQKELDREFNRIRMQAADRGQVIDAAEIPKIKTKVLESLINREVLYQQSRAQGIVVAPPEIERSFETAKQQLGTRRSFEEALRTLQISENEFRLELSKALMVQKLLDTEVYQKVAVEEKEARVFYENNPQFFTKPEQVRASHILIRVDPQADEAQRREARKRIEAVQVKLRQGEDFGETAKHFSECPSAKNGGDLGVFDRKKMVKPFADAAFSLSPGEISGIVETQFGYHIIKVFEKIPQSKLTYPEIKDRLLETLRNQKIQKYFF